MKRILLKITILFIPILSFSQTTFKAYCNRPNNVYLGIDTTKCTKLESSSNNILFSYYKDTSIVNTKNLFTNSEFSLETGSKKIFYLDENVLIISDSSIESEISFTFNENKTIRKMNIADSCKYKRMIYSEKTGELVYIFCCDYSKKGECYSQNFKNGNVWIERFYVPWKFSGIDNFNKVNMNYWDIKAIPIKENEYDENHNLIGYYFFDEYGNTKR